MLIAKLEVRENRGSWAEGVPVEKKKRKTDYRARTVDGEL